MAPLGPFAPTRRLAVACSGGADSMALTLLAAHWGDVLALIVDHGLRPESVAEAEQVRRWLTARAIPARVLRLRGVRPVAEAAREARFAALEAACLEEGLLDLALGHHARDQAETILIRRAQGSGPAGLAGMAPVAAGRGVRRLRPLLSIAPGRLRATLRAMGQDWVEDPSNRDMRWQRARVRAKLDDADGEGAEVHALTAQAARDAATRAREEAEAAAYLARNVSLRPEGFAVLPATPMPPAAMAGLLRMVAGSAYAPPRAAVADLAANPRPATLWGVRLLPAGRLTSGAAPALLAVREAAAMAGPVPARPGALWDGRFRLVAAPHLETPDQASIGALGAEAAGLRRLSPLPAAVLQTLPALRVNGMLAAVPQIGYGYLVLEEGALLFCPANPACGLDPRAAVPADGQG